MWWYFKWTNCWILNSYYYYYSTYRKCSMLNLAVVIWYWLGSADFIAKTKCSMVCIKTSDMQVDVFSTKPFPLAIHIFTCEFDVKVISLMVLFNCSLWRKDLIFTGTFEEVWIYPSTSTSRAGYCLLQDGSGYFL